MATSAGIAVDIGGTFTDIVLSRADGAVFVHKVSSTTREPERAVVAGIAAILDHAEVAARAVREILHGTTVGSNAILQRAGARTGLLTTRGFRDVLEIGRVRTPELYDLAWDKPEPLVRRHRLEVSERIGADGSVLAPLDEASVIAAADADGQARELPAKVTMTIRAGDVIRHEQPGGGGHGDPALRDPAAIARDLEDGKITTDHARRFYAAGGGKRS